jgi:hypothetical protein
MTTDRQIARQARRMATSSLVGPGRRTLERMGFSADQVKVVRALAARFRARDNARRDARMAVAIAERQRGWDVAAAMLQDWAEVVETSDLSEARYYYGRDCDGEQVCIRLATHQPVYECSSIAVCVTAHRYTTDEMRALPANARRAIALAESGAGRCGEVSDIRRAVAAAGDCHHAKSAARAAVAASALDGRR